VRGRSELVSDWETSINYADRFIGQTPSDWEMYLEVDPEDLPIIFNGVKFTSMIQLMEQSFAYLREAREQSDHTGHYHIPFMNHAGEELVINAQALNESASKIKILFSSMAPTLEEFNRSMQEITNGPPKTPFKHRGKR
jgi:hypothetical protein